MSGILSGSEIEKRLHDGGVVVTRENEDGGEVPILWDRSPNPASLDLTLGSEVAVYSSITTADFSGEIPGQNVRPSWGNPYSAIPFSPRTSKIGPVNYLDAKAENPVETYKMDDRGIILMPGVGYLMHTRERVFTREFVPIVDGKSSIGRLFCLIHFTAGFGDSGFDGQYTLEVMVLAPLRVYPDMRFCQIRFHTIEGAVVDYSASGNYVGKNATGPVPSRSWKAFIKNG